MTPETQQKALERIDSCIVQIDKTIAAYEARLATLSPVSQAGPVASDEAPKAPKAAKAATAVKARSKSKAAAPAEAADTLAPPPPALAPAPPPSGDLGPHVPARVAVAMATDLLDQLQKNSKSKKLTIEVKNEVDKDGALKVNHSLKIKLADVALIPKPGYAILPPLFVLPKLKADAGLGIHLVYNKEDTVGVGKLVTPKPNAQPAKGGVNVSLGGGLALELYAGIDLYGLEVKVFMEAEVKLELKAEATVKGEEYELKISMPLKAALNVGYKVVNDILSEKWVVGSVEILNLSGLSLFVSKDGSYRLEKKGLKLDPGKDLRKIYDNIVGVADRALMAAVNDPAKAALLFAAGPIAGTALYKALEGVNVTKALKDGAEAVADGAEAAADYVTSGEILDDAGDVLSGVGSALNPFD